MREILVIRFGALGDLCVLGRTLAALADHAPGPRRVTLATKSAFAPLMGRMRGVDAVEALQPGGAGALVDLAGRLGRRRWDLVLDAHANLRSTLLCALLGRRPDARLAKDTPARLAFMAAGRPSPALDRHMTDRFAAVLAPAGAAAGRPLAPPLELPRDSGTGVLGLAPGAQWDTKRWPEAHWADLLVAHLRQGGRARIFLGPREATWYPDGPLAAAAAGGGVDVVRDAPLVEVAARLAGIDRLVTNDSGLLHLAEAVGTPVVALFGPTVREFGYYPSLPASRVLETELACRPCSRNGKRPCHRGDLACLDRISPAAVLAAAGEPGAAPEATP